ncbi:MAG: hypothetical protein GX066_05765 [Clostridiaceae bacterium]|nr:hypothetical protein [Clostridiaceae bacterium]
MSVKIGIPRALLYYEYYPMWKTFFQELGLEVVLSDPTTKTILNDGVKHCVDEACLPVKLFHGHVINLKNRADYIFIPKLTSIARGEYICPKFCGLPEMVGFSIKDLPPVIDVEINLRNPKSVLYKSFEQIGRYFTQDTRLIKAAFNKAMEAQKYYLKSIKQGKLPSELLENQKFVSPVKADLRIALIGHVYNLYDKYISMDILSKLKKQGIEVITPEQLEDAKIEEQANRMNKKMFWSFGKRLLGATLCLKDRKDIDGIIFIMSFGCGVDAFISDLCERRIRRETGIPFFLLTIDEHSGEAGVNTRIEAFLDMIRWRRKNEESNISAYG